MAKRAARTKRPLLTPDQARAIYAYNFRVFDRFVRRVRRLPGRAARKRREIGHQSLFDTLVHILNVQEVWLTYIVRGRNSDAELGTLFRDARRHPRDWKGFRAYERRVRAGLEAYLAELTPREMRRPVHVFWMPGDYTVSDAILQTTFEEAHHLGEIIGALWQEDLPSPEMTWIGVGRAARRGHS
ncbi:MAG TPA: DinB family protein [Thermoplasmata archaeon]|nr:DinB family protein [Thermoplasmata archaeon]